MKRVAVILAEGFEEIEAITPVDILRRAGVAVTSFSISNSITVKGSHNIPVIADDLFSNFIADDFDALILPGGQPGSANLANDSRVINAVCAFHSANRIIAAICAAPTVLLKAGVLHGVTVTAHPSVSNLFNRLSIDGVCSSGSFITAKSAATALNWALAIAEALNCDSNAIARSMPS